MQKGEFIGNQNGLNWILAAFFLVTDMSIAGMLALPAGIYGAQFYPGLVIFLLMASITAISAHFLGQSWEILLRRFPQEYAAHHCRKPYAEIGFRAFGPKMKCLVSICVNLTQFGAATVFLLLCAKNIRDFLISLFHFDVNICLLLLLLAALIWPITLLKSPNDFWPVLFGGIFCTFSAFLLICAGSIFDLANQNHSASKNAPFLPAFNLDRYSSGFGTILFAFGGHPAIPTIQHDMRQPKDFCKSVSLGFGIIFAFNLAVILLTIPAYGPNLQGTIVNSLSVPWVSQSVLVLATANSLLSIILVINPLNQEAEEFFGVPQEFCWRRVSLRSAVLFGVLFVAETAPNFGPMLDFFAGSTISMTSIIFPWLFHYMLTQNGGKIERELVNFDFQNAPQKSSKIVNFWGKINKWTAIYAFVILFAIFIGIFVTFSALKELTGVQFVKPCYLQIF